MPDHIYSINEIKSIVETIGKQYGVGRVLLFGSYARGEAKLNSDIDLLIERGNIRGLFQLSGFLLDLEERFRTRVDVLTIDSLDEEFLRRIEKEEIVIYEQ
jgi:hypothetical protein